jgi:hypothetical protein
LKNEVVYYEGKVGEKIILIYEGQFRLLKYKYSNEVKEYNINNMMNFFTIVKLVKEDISGIEILNYDRYKFTLIVFYYN